MNLDKLAVGKSAKVLTVGGEGALRQHFLDMGVIPGEYVTVTKLAPMGDPMQFTIHGYELTMRLADAAKIEIKEVPSSEVPVYTAENLEKIYEGQKLEEQTENEKVEEKRREEEAKRKDSSIHPGLGEEGKYHDKRNEHPLPEDTILTFALAGNQNSGKTTLFNQLTGANQHVGNFPGVTVDRKDGVIRGHKNTLVTDLPGIYSMSPYSSEEIVTRQFILDEKPKGLINIVDATNIERNLYLTLQLIELNVPMVVALNMMDEVRENGGTILVNRLEKLLGVPVVPISAAKNEGVDELISHLIHVAHYQEKPANQDFCGENDHGGAVHRAIHSVMHLIQDHCKRLGIPVRFAACKLIEGDHLIAERLELDQNEKETIEHIIKQMEEERGLDRAAAIADMRFDFIQRVCAQTIVKPKESIEHRRSRQIDRILTGRFTAIPCFVGIMALVFYLTFNVIGAALQNLLQAGIDALAGAADAWMTAAHVNQVVHSLVINAVFNGVGTVLSFMPIIVIMFFFLSILEDSGYIARVAFFMDKLLRKIGLSGRSIVPMLIGFGCSVPAVMATRTLPSKRDRRMTVLLIPFMSCSAKLPIYGFLTAAFFPGKGGLIMVLLYFIGIAVGILTALILKKTGFKGEAVPFVMELPNYRMPGAKSVLILMWEKTKDFIQRAFSVIFIATLVVWFLQSFDLHLNLTADPQNSILAVVAALISPIFKPLGFADWRVTTALVAGFMAKESVVATLNVLVGGQQAVASLLTPLAGFCLLIFCLLYTPCVAAVSAIKREMGAKTTAFVVIFQIAVAWVVAFLFHLIGSMIGFV